MSMITKLESRKDGQPLLTRDMANELLHIFLDMGEKLMGSGAEVKRVEDTLSRLGSAYGADKMNVFVITSSIVVTMELPGGEKVTQTRRILETERTDFTSLEAVPISAGTHPDGKFSVWTASKTLEIRQDSCAFFPCRTKNFLANLHTAADWYSFLVLEVKLL